MSQSEPIVEIHTTATVTYNAHYWKRIYSREAAQQIAKNAFFSFLKHKEKTENADLVHVIGIISDTRFSKCVEFSHSLFTLAERSTADVIYVVRVAPASFACEMLGGVEKRVFVREIRYVQSGSSMLDKVSLWISMLNLDCLGEKRVYHGIFHRNLDLGGTMEVLNSDPKMSFACHTAIKNRIALLQKCLLVRDPSVFRQVFPSFQKELIDCASSGETGSLCCLDCASFHLTFLFFARNNERDLRWWAEREAELAVLKIKHFCSQSAWPSIIRDITRDSFIEAHANDFRFHFTRLPSALRFVSTIENGIVSQTSAEMLESTLGLFICNAYMAFPNEPLGEHENVQRLVHLIEEEAKELKREMKADKAPHPPIEEAHKFFPLCAWIWHENIEKRRVIEHEQRASIVGFYRELEYPVEDIGKYLFKMMDKNTDKKQEPRKKEIAGYLKLKQGTDENNNPIPFGRQCPRMIDRPISGKDRWGLVGCPFAHVERNNLAEMLVDFGVSPESSQAIAVHAKENPLMACRDVLDVKTGFQTPENYKLSRKPKTFFWRSVKRHIKIELEK